MLADDVWARTRRQFEANRVNWAKQTLFYLPPSQTPETRSVDALIASGPGYLARQPANWYATRPGRELAAFAIQRITPNDPRFAADELEKIQSRMLDSEKQWAWSQVGLQAAKRHMPEALDWYAKAGNALLSDDGYQWKVRAALRAHEWGVVHKTIEAMPPTLAALPEWTYWLGRALKAGGRTTDADALFEKIAGQSNFYGNLADEELGRSIMPPPKAKAATNDEQIAARQNPGIKRAMTFFRLEMRTEGVREWNWSLRGMDDRELLAVADLAKRNQIWDRAITAADKTKYEHDYSLRFLSPYGEQVRPAAQNQSIDDAWVYGLMRQESRFVTNARSSVGAGGLMQVMPSTAQWVANRLKIPYHAAMVNDVGVNIRLGTYYLSNALKNLGNQPVLATAGYNAGPGRARQWQHDTRALDADIYVESIPFAETRDYVKKVMTNAVHYAIGFGMGPQSLSSRMGVIPYRAAKAVDMP